MLTLEGSRYAANKTFFKHLHQNILNKETKNKEVVLGHPLFNQVVQMFLGCSVRNSTPLDVMVWLLNFKFLKQFTGSINEHWLKGAAVSEAISEGSALTASTLGRDMGVGV